MSDKPTPRPHDDDVWGSVSPSAHSDNPWDEGSDLADEWGSDTTPTDGLTFPAPSTPAPASSTPAPASSTPAPTPTPPPEVPQPGSRWSNDTASFPTPSPATTPAPSSAPAQPAGPFTPDQPAAQGSEQPPNRNWKVPVIIAAVVVLIAAAGIVVWPKLGAESGAGGKAYAAGAPQHVSSTPISSLSNTKIGLGFVLPKQYGQQMNARRVKVQGKHEYVLPQARSHNTRMLRIDGTDNAGNPASAIIGINSGNKVSPPLAQIPLPPGVNCALEPSHAQCEDLPAITWQDLQPSGATTSPVNTGEGSGKADTNDTAAGKDPQPTQDFDQSYSDNAQYPYKSAPSRSEENTPQLDQSDQPAPELPPRIANDLPVDGGAWIFPATDPAEENARTVVLTPQKIKIYTGEELDYEYSLPQEFAELNHFDTNPTFVLLGTLLIFAVQDTIRALDITTHNVPWEINAPLSDWAINDGEIITLHDNIVNLYQLTAGESDQETQVITPPAVPSDQIPLTAADFMNATYEVPLPDPKSPDHEVKTSSYTFKNGASPFTYVRGGGLKPIRTKLEITYTAPVSHENKPYTLVEFSHANTSGQYSRWVIYDQKKHPVHSWDFTKLKELPYYGPGGDFRVFSPIVVGDTFYFPQPMLSTPGDDEDADCFRGECSLHQVKMLQWQGDELVPADTLFSAHGRVFKMPKESDVQALLDAWAYDDPEKARPYVDELDEFMKRRNEILGAPKPENRDKARWGEIVFQGKPGRIRYCDVVTAQGKSASHYKELGVRTSEPGLLACTFDSAMEDQVSRERDDEDSSRDSSELNAIGLITDENGHITKAEMWRSWS